MSGRPWFLGQTPPPVEATQDELDAEGMAKLTGWVREAIVAKGMGIDLDELDAWVHDLEDTASTPRGAPVRIDWSRVDATTEEEIEAQAAQDDAEAEADAQRYAASRGAVYRTTEGAAMGGEYRPAPGWLAKDVRRASERLAEWSTPRAKSAPVIDYETPGD